MQICRLCGYDLEEPFWALVEPLQLRFGFSDSEIEDMPLSRLSQRIVREEERSENEERERRRSLWVQFLAITFTARSQKEPPKTREEYEQEKRDQKRKTVREPSAKEWKQQAKAREQYDKLNEAVGLAAWHPAHFEELFRFPSHMFGEPPEVPESAEDKLTPKEREKIGEAIFMEKLKARQAEMTAETTAS